ncbi:pilus assembly protein PilP [Pseudomonas sp. CCM 7893]|uniref:Pilus assembly protein PilP n=1 Tax=Pseudomonas spelaei TaxID=1055469 RepID=A0A6I3W9A4_9PSED|nr:pilus assembly protein PilP [Pseudomonas spelaei]MUF04541.1 pilus assembly protein PilP [Pseudomonas spelaei]
MSRVKGVCLAFGLVSLVGCGGGGDVQALEAQLREIRQRPVAPIEVVPQPVSRQRFVYDPASLRDPFRPPSLQVERATGRSALGPDPGRLRGFLEGFAIEQFEMVGTLSRGGQTFALLRGATAVHRLAVGDYLGSDHGQVTAIHDSHIELVELFPDGEGAWLERSRTLALNVHS